MANQVVAARQQKRGLLDLLNDPKVKEGFNAVATKHLTPERMVRLCVSAVKNTPLLAKCTTSSVLGAMMTAHSLGLEPNTALGHAYLIPYKRKRKVNGQFVEEYECQFQLGYKGLLALALRQPNIIAIQADAIHENDQFEHSIGSETLLKFSKTLTGRGDLVGAFVHVEFVDQFKNRGQMIYVMPLDEIEKIREESDTYTYLREQAESADAKPWQKEKFAATPWVKWFDQMAIKSAIKRACKMLDLGGAVAAAAEVDSLVETGRLDIGRMVDVAAVQDIKDGIVIDHEAIPDERDDEPANAAPEPKMESEKKPAAKKAEKKQAEKNPAPKPGPEASDGPAGEEPPPPEPDDIDPLTGEVLEDGSDDPNGEEDNNLFADE